VSASEMEREFKALWVLWQELKKKLKKYLKNLLILEEGKIKCSKLHLEVTTSRNRIYKDPFKLLRVGETNNSKKDY
jgi:hypothetical protein